MGDVLDRLVMIEHLSNIPVLPWPPGIPSVEVGFFAWMILCQHIVRDAAVHKPSTAARFAEIELGRSCEEFLATSALGATKNNGRHQLSRGVPSPLLPTG
jgi:hypothetical protein